jgi:hypothetical protein
MARFYSWRRRVGELWLGGAGNGNLSPLATAAPLDPESKLRSQVEAVKAARERLGFMNLSGDPILRLPETTDDSDSSNGTDPADAA